MSGGTTMIKDFTTPDRAPNRSGEEEKKDLSPKEAVTDVSQREKPKAAFVTPPEPAREADASKQDHGDASLKMVTSEVDSPEDKHVRFDKDGSPTDSPSSQNSQRGLVSRRGGRYSSPARAAKPSAKEAVLEFKTYRSPPRNKKDDNENVPSLCSAKSFDKPVKKEDTDVSTSTEDKKPTSISCDASMSQASPLASDPSQEAKDSQSKDEEMVASVVRKNNVTFSPVPPPRDSEKMKTPMKSPTGGRFQSLPTLDDGGLKSPVGIFLSPQPPTPRDRFLERSESFDKTEKEEKKAKGEKKSEARAPLRSPKTPTPRTPTRDMSRDRCWATPTDFTMDYGKHPSSNSFESSNVLAWLHSPTANGLFSPGGGLGSLMNTPRTGGLDPRTPRTPTVSTSFFFSDVAGLPRSGDYTSPKPSSDSVKRPASGKGGYSNIICISPLASSKAKNGTAGPTPTINYKDMFASPAERARGLPLLGDSPLKGSRSRVGGGPSGSKDPSLDAVHMVQRDLMEDEDLSVLLQLASNTPKNGAGRPSAVSNSEGNHVFRSPKGNDENLPSLQLPIIFGRDSEGNGTRLARKTHSRDHGDTADDFHRPLEIRSGKVNDVKGEGAGKNGGPDDKRKDSSTSDGSKKTSKTSNHHPPSHYAMPRPYSHHDAPYYPPMPPGMPSHAGSMRVAVGVPPPVHSKSGSPSRGSPHGSRPYSMGPGDPNYAPPPYPPPPGHYSHHPPPHMHPHYSHYPPPHHHPPPRHMPMYGAQHPLSKSKPPKKPLKSSKPGAKRPAPAPLPKPSSAKKAKKASPSSSSKKKNRSPQITDKVERQKAAAAVQAVNQASGGKNDKAAALAAAILRGVTMRPSGKWQAQLYFAGKSRYIGVFDTREKAALAYEIAREKLKSEKASAEGGSLNAKQTEAAVNAARKAAFEGVNERDPRLAGK